MSVSVREPTPRPSYLIEISALAGRIFTGAFTAGVVVYNIWDQIVEPDWRFLLCMGVALAVAPVLFFNVAFRRWGDGLGRIEFLKNIILRETLVQVRLASRALFAHLMYQLQSVRGKDRPSSDPVEEKK